MAAFQADLIRAQIQDKEDLSALLYKLAENDRQILDAIQDQSGAYKRLEDLLIGVYKVSISISLSGFNIPTFFFSMSNIFPSRTN